MRFLQLPLYAALCALAACSADSSPEQQVRTVIEQMEAGAEARDVGAVMEHVSENYRDPHGQGRNELSHYVRGYFLANQSVHLLTHIENIEFPTADEARLKVRVGMAGRQAQGGAADLSTDLQRFDVVLMREDGDWKITYADSRAH